MGVERYTAAMYGFDDKVFYDEVEAYANDRISQLKMGNVLPGLLQDEIQEELFRNSATKNDDPTTPPTDPVTDQEATLDEQASKYMRLAIKAAKLGPQSVGAS